MISLLEVENNQIKRSHIAPFEKELAQKVIYKDVKKSLFHTIDMDNAVKALTTNEFDREYGQYEWYHDIKKHSPEFLNEARKILTTGINRKSKLLKLSPYIPKDIVKQVKELDNNIDNLIFGKNEIIPDKETGFAIFEREHGLYQSFEMCKVGKVPSFVNYYSHGANTQKAVYMANEQGSEESEEGIFMNTMPHFAPAGQKVIEIRDNNHESTWSFLDLISGETGRGRVFDFEYGLDKEQAKVTRDQNLECIYYGLKTANKQCEAFKDNFRKL